MWYRYFNEKNAFKAQFILYDNEFGNIDRYELMDMNDKCMDIDDLDSYQRSCIISGCYDYFEKDGNKLPYGVIKVTTNDTYPDWFEFKIAQYNLISAAYKANLLNKNILYKKLIRQIKENFNNFYSSDKYERYCPDKRLYKTLYDMAQNHEFTASEYEFCCDIDNLKLDVD